MKTTKPLTVLLGLVLSLGIYAQDDLLDSTSEVLDSAQIDIDGYYSEKPKETAADRVAKMRKKLEEQNEQMVQKKIEDIRIREEKKLANQLQKAFSNGLQNVDQVSTTQAAPQKIEKPAPVVAPVKKRPENKIIPSFGVLNIQTEKEDFESNINAGITFENMVHERVAVGFGIGYTQMDLIDVSNTFISNQFGFNNQFFGPVYNNSFGEGREMNYSKLSMTLTSKVYMTVDSRIRPFAGVGLGYNRSTLEYADNGNNFQFNNVSFGDESYKSSYVSGTAMIGTEIAFTDTIGMILDVTYTKSLTDGFSSDSATDGFVNPDQRRLENVGSAIEEANFFGINAGLVVSF